MQSFIALLLVLLLVIAPASAQSGAARGYVPSPTASARIPAANTLLDGTPVKLRLAQNLTSATARAGDSVAFDVTEDVLVDGVVVLPKGASALATITDANPRRRMGRGGKLDVNIDSARLIDGEKVQLRASQDNRGGGHVGAMTGAMVVTGLFFFPAAPLFLFVHGKDVTVPKGTEITAFVEGDMSLDMVKLGAASSPSLPRFAAAGSGLMIDASIPNCDIEVDGAFAGSTPSTLNVSPGKHEIVVKRSGYADWTRTINFAGGNVHVSAEMVKPSFTVTGSAR
jgi:hypothetical protein